MGRKAHVAVKGTNKVITVEEGATKGAQLGVNLYDQNGDLLTLAALALALGIGAPDDGRDEPALTIWQNIGQIPDDAYTVLGNPTAAAARPIATKLVAQFFPDDMVTILSGTEFEIETDLLDLHGELRVEVDTGVLRFFGGEAAAVTLDPASHNTKITLSGGNLIATRSSVSGGAWGSVKATAGVSAGKKYFEMELTSLPGGAAANPGNPPNGVLFGGAASSLTADQYVGQSATSYGYQDSNVGALKYNNAVSTPYGGNANTTLMCAIDMDTGKIWTGTNGTWFSSGDPAAGTNEMYSGLTGTIFPAVALFYATDVVTFRFTAASWAYAAPSGFSEIEGASGNDATLRITSDGGAIIELIADEDNSGEGDNPAIYFSQDGDTIEASIGLGGNAGSDSLGNSFSGAPADTLAIHALSATGSISIGTESVVALLINATNGVDVINGMTFRVMDATEADSIAWTHNGTDMLCVLTGTTVYSMTGAAELELLNGMDLWIRDAGFLRIYDSADTDYAQFEHNGSNFLTTFTNTSAWEIAGASHAQLVGGMDFWVRDGAYLRISDASDLNYVQLEHNGTNLVTTFATTTAWDISGAAEIELTGGMDLWLRDAGFLRIYDSTDTDYAQFEHNGTDFLTAFTGTSSWTISGPTSAVELIGGTRFQVRDGASIRLYDTGDTDYGNFSHDGTNLILAHVNTTMFRIEDVGVVIPDGVLQIGDGAFNEFVTGNRRFEIAYAGQAFIAVRNETDNLEFFMGAGTSGVFFGAATAHDLIFRTDNTSRMVLRAEGLEDYADDAAAAAGGVAISELYRNGSVIQIRVA